MARKSIEERIAQARSEVTEHTPAEAQRRAAEEGAIILDIRDVRELQKQGVIAGAAHAPRGMLEFWFAPDSAYKQDIYMSADTEYILHCALGWRSALAAVDLQNMGVEKVSHIETGFEGWVEDGLEVQSYEDWKLAKKQAK